MGAWGSLVQKARPNDCVKTRCDGAEAPLVKGRLFRWGSGSRSVRSAESLSIWQALPNMLPEHFRLKPITAIAISASALGFHAVRIEDGLSLVIEFGSGRSTLQCLCSIAFGIARTCIRFSASSQARRSHETVRLNTMPRCAWSLALAPTPSSIA